MRLLELSKAPADGDKLSCNPVLNQVPDSPIGGDFGSKQRPIGTAPNANAVEPKAGRGGRCKFVLVCAEFSPRIAPKFTVTGKELDRVGRRTSHGGCKDFLASF